ncbi:Retrovirus-related Pol polyprotein from transposon 17.6 [Vitis vinifera]|uniref:RNA-directed DNA polymerase n=1 Tax=Vitis vinifera TaxID=29760 RepID=A0A438CIJ9_VITVI|nr:Retrovirus-related Pol polyprotein from transposon 17.6 [Vitis vinifera]
MARKIEEMELRKVHKVQAILEPQQQANPCSICQSFEHMVEECPTIPAAREMFGEQANLIGQWKPNPNAPYGNTYNSSWRNHPNFAWKPRPNPYQSPAQSSQQSQGQSLVEQALVSLSKVMGDFVSKQKSINSQLNQKIDNVESTLNKKIDGMHNELSQKIDNIQYSISRLTNLNTVNEKGKFPSQPHQNPKGIHEVESKDEDSSKVRDVQAIITLRSGKEVHQPEHDQRKAKEDKADRKEEKKNEQKGKEVQMKESIIPSMDEEPQILLKEGMMKKHMPPPFPQALRGKKPIKNVSEILDVLRQVKENIPLLDMIKQVPTYAKFLKDLCTVKRGLNVTKQAFLTEQVSAIIQCKSPIKYKDPGCPTISVNIGGTQVEKALLDLGASVNLLPYSVYKELGLGELKPTSITLSLADRLVKIPRGVIEDVLVQVDKFYYPVDFVVLDTDPIVKGINYVPIILGRPFLATSNAIINCRNGVMQLTFGNMTLELNIFHLCQKHIHPEEDEGPEEVCMIDTLVEEHCNQSILDQFEENSDESHEDLDDGLAKPMGMNAVMSNWRQKPVILPLFKDEEEMKEAKDAILKLELKTLPAELKYAYLEEGNKAPVVISSSLTVSQEDNLLRILRKHKKAIGWQIFYLKGISPLICTHHIYMEEGAKPTRQPQRRLNPHMQEVVRAEVLKLLQAGIIYPFRIALGKLNAVTRKDHFPLPFMDQVLERVSGHPFYCFLDGYSGYFQIEIDVEDQEKTTFTCPFGTYAYRRMPFGLCNAPATFQRCMLSIFSDMVERIMEVFMDDITVYGTSFEDCLSHLEDVLKRCIEKDLVLNWEKCHFMVNQGIVLGHVISKKGIEVDRAKVELIVKLPPPTNVKGIRQFLGHAGFYRRFIKDFSKIAKPLCELLVKDAKFEWDDKCQRSFELLKQFLTSAPIVRAPNWELPFEVMCDSSDYAIGAVLGQREDGKPYVIYYASKSLNDAQKNYTTTEKELLAVVYALDKFRAYLIGSSIVVFTDHSALKYLLTKQDAKARLIRWILLLQEFNLQIRDKKGVENVVADHLSRLNIAHDTHGLPINDDFPEESLMLVEEVPWFAHIANYLVTGEIPSEWSSQDKKNFFAKVHAYYWEESFLFKYCADQIIRKCVPEQEKHGILSHCHENACGGHFASQKTAMRVLQSGFWWPSLFKDAHEVSKGCDKCQRLGKLSRRNMMPLNPILIVDLFDVWGIDFMGPFPMSFGLSYILVGVDYVSKWVEAIPCRTNDHKVVLKFLKENIFSRLECLKQSSVMEALTFATSPLKLFWPSTELSISLPSSRWGAIKKLNMDLTKAGLKRSLDLNELEELRNDAYLNSKIAKKKLKRWHDQLVTKKEFFKGQRVLLYDSKLHLFPGKLKSRWVGPFVIHQVHSHGVIELLNSNSAKTFKVNGQRLKPYIEPFSRDKEYLYHGTDTGASSSASQAQHTAILDQHSAMLSQIHHHLGISSPPPQEPHP